MRSDSRQVQIDVYVVYVQSKLHFNQELYTELELLRLVKKIWSWDL